MVTCKTQGRAVEITAYQIPEYVDPAGAQMPPWDRPYIISSAIVEREKWDAETLTFYQMPDDSMSYRARRGDIVIIDAGDRAAPRDGAMYLIEHPGGARLRWVFVQQDGGLILAPDSPLQRYRQELVLPDNAPHLRIAGRTKCIISFLG